MDAVWAGAGGLIFTVLVTLACQAFWWWRRRRLVRHYLESGFSREEANLLVYGPEA